MEPSKAPKMRVQILDEIQAFMRRHTTTPGGWYVGTAAAGRATMFDVHGFRSGDVSLFRTAANPSDAASVAAYLIKRGAEGDEEEKPQASSTYVFKKSAHTLPPL